MTDQLQDIKSALKEIQSIHKENLEEIEALRTEADNNTCEVSFVGLDTIHWRLENGNLNIQSKMESFIRLLQEQNAVTPAPSIKASKLF